MKCSESWLAGFKSGIPIFLGYFAVSFTFGIAAQNILEPFQAVLMSAMNFTSAGQFAALSLIAISSPLWEVALSQVIINLRYSLMACFLSQKLASDIPFYHRFFLAMGLTDEVFGICATRAGKLDPVFAYGVMSSALPGWVLGTFLGSISHTWMPPRMLSAFGIAIYGMFIAIIFPPVRENRILGAIIFVSMLCSFIFTQVPLLQQITPGVAIIMLTLIIASIAALLFPVIIDHPVQEQNNTDN